VRARMRVCVFVCVCARASAKRQSREVLLPEILKKKKWEGPQKAWSASKSFCQKFW